MVFSYSIKSGQSSRFAIPSGRILPALGNGRLSVCGGGAFQTLYSPVPHFLSLDL